MTARWIMVMITMVNLATYMNALKSKCVLGGRPGNETTKKKTIRKFLTTR